MACGAVRRPAVFIPTCPTDLFGGGCLLRLSLPAPAPQRGARALGRALFINLNETAAWLVYGHWQAAPLQPPATAVAVRPRVVLVCALWSVALPRLRRRACRLPRALLFQSHRKVDDDGRHFCHSSIAAVSVATLHQTSSRAFPLPSNPPSTHPPAGESISRDSHLLQLLALSPPPTAYSLQLVTRSPQTTGSSARLGR